MEFIGVLVVAALVFGVCFLIDKGFTKLFRSQAQHRSGLALRLSKKYGAIGLILFVFGLATIFSAQTKGWVLAAGGVLIILVGIWLVVYYMTYGVFYDDEGFIFTTLGRKSKFYRYSDIKSQQLFNSRGIIVIELQMTDGRSVQLQDEMNGVYTFMDHAFSAWCAQKGIDPDSCKFHDPAISCWFPNMEDV